MKAVGSRPAERRAEAQADADLRHAIARHERAVVVEARDPEGLGEAPQNRELDHVCADASQAHARQVEFAHRGGLRPGRREQVVPEARTVGDGGAAARDQRKPLHRPAGEVAGRQQVDAALCAHRRQDEPDQAHVVIERQPAHARIVIVEPLRGDRPVDVRHELVLSYVDTERRTRAAGRELHVARHARAERPQVGLGLGNGVEVRHPSGKARRRAFRGGLGELDQFVGGEYAHRLRCNDLLPELKDVVRLGAKPDRYRNGNRNDAGILGTEEGDAKARPCVRDQDQPFARRNPGADQAAREGLRVGLELPVGQTGQQPPAGIEEVEAGLAPRGIVQRLAQAGEAAAAEGQGHVVGGRRDRYLATRVRLQGRRIALHAASRSIGRRGIWMKRRQDSSDRRHRTISQSVRTKRVTARLTGPVGSSRPSEERRYRRQVFWLTGHSSCPSSQTEVQ